MLNLDIVTLLKILRGNQRKKKDMDNKEGMPTVSRLSSQKMWFAFS